MSVNNYFNPLPMGSVRPLGWLRSTLRRQASGLTGLMDRVPPRRGFRINPVTGNSVWLGGSAGKDFLACRSERAPYYLRGLTALAAVTGDRALFQKAGNWLDYWFRHQEKDGRLKARGVSDYEWWPRAIILDIVRFYHEATGDTRSISFMEHFFHFQRNNLEKHPLTKNLKYHPEWRSWASFRGGDYLDSLGWLYERSGDLELLRLAEIINRQTYPWEKTFLKKEDISTHGVNLAHGLRKPAAEYRLRPDGELIRAAEAGITKVMQQHGQVSGVYSCDEITHGRGSTRGAELCTVVELMRTYTTMQSVWGLACHGDALERLAFNALPAAVAPDFLSHQYFSQPNQIYCTIGKHGFYVNNLDLPYPLGWHHDSLTFGAPSGYECCFYNFHLGWPLYTAGMWMKYKSDGLAAAAYGPCEVETSLEGMKLRIVEETGYPFEDRIYFSVHCEKALTFSLLLRVPEWCNRGTAVVAGETFHGAGGSYIEIRRKWRGTEKVVLDLPAKPRIVSRPEGALSVERGALVFAYNPEELWISAGNSAEFPTYEVLPEDEKPVKKHGKWTFRESPSWNRGISGDASLAVERAAINDSGDVAGGDDIFPWTPGNAPLKLKVAARCIPGWTRQDSRKTGLNAGPLPRKPVATVAKEKEIKLVPYGCARLRISMFPEIG